MKYRIEGIAQNRQDPKDINLETDGIVTALELSIGLAWLETMSYATVKDPFGTELIRVIIPQQEKDRANG